MFMPNKNRNLFVYQAINESLKLSMKKNKNVIMIGLGINDPKGIFGTTRNLNKILKGIGYLNFRLLKME